MKKWIFLSTLVFAAPLFPQTNATTFVFSEALIWQIREANATNWGQILTPANSDETIQFLAVPFKWNPGLRVGAGFSSDEKLWDVLFYYTGYKTRGRNRADTNTGEIHSAFSSNFYASNPQGNGISGPYYHHAGIQWGVAFNTLDLEFAHTITMDSLASFRPFLGIKAGSIKQSIHTYWRDPYEPTTAQKPTPTPITTFSSATERIANDFNGLGPSIGLDTTWHIYTTLDLIGNVSGAFLWGNWTFSDIYQNNAPQTIATVSDRISSSAFMGKVFLGIDWSNIAHNANWNLRFGYEIQAWFNQLQYYSFDMGKTNDTLYLQGAVLGFGVYC